MPAKKYWYVQNKFFFIFFITIIVPCCWNHVYSHSKFSHFLSGKCLSKAFVFLTVLVLLVYCIFVCVRVCMYMSVCIFCLCFTADNWDLSEFSQCCIGYHSWCTVFSGPFIWSYIWKLWKPQLLLFTLWWLWLWLW